jgi:type VI secretion system protein ImpA
MPEAPLLDFESLIAPISGDNPAGGSVPFETRHKLEEFRKEDNPDDYAPNDPLRPEIFRKADWPGIVKLAQETLSETSKDLLVAARLTEALARVHGFAGVRDGLHLLRELVEQAWDRLQPVIEDNDLEVRAAPFYWLDDADKGARFPTTLHMLPLVPGDEVEYSWLDWRQSLDGKGNVPREDFERATTMAPIERLEAVAKETTDSLSELDGLVRALSEKMGPAAPALAAVREAIEGCHSLIGEIVRKRRPELGLETDSSEEQSDVSGATTGRAPATRAEVYRQLAQAAAVLRELEPHSPIPYLIQRAVELGSLPFPQLINALIRNDDVLSELRREFGIQEPPPPES